MAGAWIIFLQTVLSFAVLLVLTRMLGKQQVSQLTFYEYLNGITFGSIAANMATIEAEKVPAHLIGLITYGALTFGVSWLAMKNRKFRKAVAGEPVIVIQDGQILESNMRKMHLDLDELTTMLRSQGIPTKLVIGYAGDVYHAWIHTYIPEKGWIEGVIFFDGTTWKLMDPTYASSSKQSKQIMEFIGNGSNYSSKYIY